MQLAAMFTDPVVLSCACAFLGLLILKALRSRAGGKLPPGPPGVPVLGALPFIGPVPHAGLAKLAQKYGPIMYLKMGTTRTVVASSAGTARTFLKALDAKYANRLAVPSAEAITYGRQDVVFAHYGPKWKLMRKLSTMHLLGARAMADWAYVRRDEAGHLLRGMAAAAAAGETVVVSEVLVCALANIVGQITMSRRVFDAQGEDSNRYKDMIVSLLTGKGMLNISDLVPFLARLDLQGQQAKVRQIHEQFDSLTSKLLTEHAATAEDRARQGRQDFVDRLRAEIAAGAGNDSDETISEVNIKGLIFDMFAAGTDTSSVIVEWAMAEMIKNPSVMAKAQEELDRVVGRGRRLEESDLPNLPYLQACYKEALRLHPSTPLSIPHFSFEACDVDGYRIPANTQLLVNIWAIGRDPAVWEKPLEFRPERFLPGGAAEKIDPHGNCFELIPFGAGRRICGGMLAGMVFVQFFLGTLLHSFDWSLPDGVKLDMTEMAGLVIPKAVPLRAFVKPRLVPEAYV